MENYISHWNSLFIQYRPYLVSFAFRMTGSLSEAEDIVQDAFIECAKIDPATIENHKAWLTKVCSNKGLDHLKIAYKKRETYTGPWLPDAVPDSFQVWGNLVEGKTPEENKIVAESLTTSFLLLVEHLNPEERVVYLLSDIFEYSFKEIASFLEKSEAACRKIAERARKAMAAKRPHFTSDVAGAESLIAKFFDLAKAGDSAGMIDLLAAESEFWSDGGGKVSAAAVVMTDPRRIADFFKALGTSPVFKFHEFRLEYAQVNLRPGLIISRQQPSGAWAFETIISFELQDHKIARIYAQRNPDKLSILTKEKD